MHTEFYLQERVKAWLFLYLKEVISMTRGLMTFMTVYTFI